MKNLEYNWLTIFRIQIIIAVFFISQIASAQCTSSTISGYTVASTPTTCSANGKITVTIPSSLDCSNWIAEIVKQGGGNSTVAIPQTGGAVEFTSLGTGNYSLRLTNGTVSINHPQTINVSTTYVDMVYSFSSTPPSCSNTNTGTVTATINAGTGTGPFVFTLVSPTQGTIVSPPQASRSYTFTGTRGGETVTLSITDQVNGVAGCEITATRPSFTTAVNNNPNLAFNDGWVRGFNFYKNCTTCTSNGTTQTGSVDMVVNITNVTPARLNKLNEDPLNARITIGGVAYPLTFVTSNLSIFPAIAQYRYDASLPGRPQLANGTNVRVDFEDICSTLTRSMAIPMPHDDFSGFYSDPSSNPTTCATTYRLRVENFFDNGAYRSITFCPQNTLLIEKRRNSPGEVEYFTPVTFPEEITPDPNRTNPLFVSQTSGNSIAGGRAEYFLTEPGVYRVTASDACHTIVKTITISERVSVLQNATVTEVPSVLQGTSALSVNFGTVNYRSPIKVKISRVDGQTSVGYEAKAPFQLKGQKAVNFPIERDYVFTDNVARSFIVTDLPLGEYIVELENKGCPGTEFLKVERRINLTRPAEYGLLDGNIATFPDGSSDSAVKVNLGCLGSSQIVFDMGRNANVTSTGMTQLWTATPQGAPLALVRTIGTLSSGGTTLQGSFDNLNPGRYLVRVREIYNGITAATDFGTRSESGPWEYSIPVTIPDITPIRVETATVFCDTSNPNSGIVNVEITSGTVTYPLYFQLFAASDTNATNPLRGGTSPDFETFNVRSVSFQNVAQGSYFVRVSTPCYSVDTNVTVSTVVTVPTAKTSASTICQGSSATLSVFTTRNLYEVYWTEKDSVIQIGTGPSITVTPSTTKTYTAHYKLLEVYNCGDTEYESDVTINVLPINLAATVSPSSIDLCGLSGTTTLITVQNSTSGFNYEVLDANGNSFSPAISQAGSGSNLAFNIPINSLSSGNNLKIRPTSNTDVSASCTATLTTEVTVIASSKRNDLVVTGSTVCPNTNGTITINNTESGVEYEVLRDNAPLSPPVRVTGNGNNRSLTVPFSQLLDPSNEFTIRATAVGCTPIILINRPVISVRTAPVANAGADFTKTCATNPNGTTIGIAAVDGNTYAWTAVPASSLVHLSAFNIANPNANPIVPTVYTLTVTDANACKAIDEVSVNVNLGAPAINAGADFTKTCSDNTSGKLIGLSSAVSGVTYRWSSPLNSNENTNFRFLANPNTTTTYTLTATYSNGCTASDDVRVTVDIAQPNTPVITSFTQPSCTEPKGSVTLQASEVSSAQYNLTNITNSFTGAFQAGRTFTNLDPGNYTFRIKGTNGCQSQPTSSFTIEPRPATPATPTITVGSATTFCQGGSVELTSSATSGNQWFKEGNAISGATSRSLTVIESGSYTVNVSNGQCTSVASIPVVVTVNPSVAPTPITSAIANNCPLETVDLTTLQPTAATGIEFEWWTGTATSRTGTTKISNTANYSTSGAVFLWSKSTSDACYSLEGQRVDVVITPCCVANVGTIENTNPTGLVHYAPADINGYEHKNSSTPNKTVYVLVNELDQKIKYVNTVSPQFTGVAAGNYRLHALVFGPTVNPTGIVVGNAINQIQIPDYCGSTASYAVQVVPGNCISNASFTESIPNAKQYALLDTTTNQFVQVNTTGIFTTAFNGMLYQVVGFNYTGTASGIVVGGTVSGVSATGLETMAGSMVKGCTAITMQIKGVLYNDRDKNCREGNDNQEGLPRTTIYLKLLNSNRQVIKVTSTDGDALHYFTFNADLIDGTYSIILDNNADLTDNTATYPAFWKGSIQTFTIVSGRIIEQLSNIPNFVPMCLQSSTEKPAPRKTPNLQGNTYHFCFNQTATAINVDADSGAEINWYTSPTGGSASKTAPIPNTKVIGVEVCYVSQTLNGAESERTEIKIEVHPLPELPSVISGPIVVGSETTQLYSIASSSNLASYNWTLPTDWIGNSVTEQLNVIVGKQGGTIKVNAISANGCVGPEQQLDVRVVIEDDIEIYNSISPNGDGVNDELIIRNIDFYPNNTLEIYNRWGVLVYQADGYGQKNVLFKGLSDGRTTINRNEELPEGTYFYTLMYVNSKGIQRQKAGYLYIKQ